MYRKANSVYRRTPTALVAAIAVGLAFGLYAILAGPAAAAPPDGFTDSRVTSVPAPTSIAFTPDERMLVSTQQGRIKVYKDGSLVKTPALNLGNRVCSNSERGLLGMAVDPQFETNKFIYVYYTFNKHDACPAGDPTNKSNPVNRVARYKLSDGNRASFDRVLIDNIPSPNGNHNAGDLHFGKDGFLYVSVGDGGRDYRDDSGRGGSNDAARDSNVLLGKILRVNRNGRVPSTNPYADTGDRCGIRAANGRTAEGRQCQETFASGLRNPFRFAFDPNSQSTRFFINDVGQNAWEEINESSSGADYGWNVCEGTHDNPDRRGNCGSAEGLTDPIHEYSHSSGCSSITGGAFVPNDVWPDSFDDSYLYGDYVCGKIFKLTPDGSGGYDKADFVTGLGGRSAVAMVFGPFENKKALYYTTYANGGEVRRITYTDAPSAELSADPTSAPEVPVTVEFDGSGSRDPNPGDTLEYIWDFGDGTPTETTSTAKTSHEYTEAGVYEASLRVRDSSGATSGLARVKVYPGNAPPEPEITSPSTNLRFKVGQKISARSVATDAQDGTVPGSRMKWEVIRHHNGNHTHPYRSGTGSSIGFLAPPPEDLAATGPGNYLELKLTATDSEGLSSTVTQRIQPRRVKMRFRTTPLDLGLRVEGQDMVAPRTITSWWGYGLEVEAFRQRDRFGRLWLFKSWSDGRAASHEIVTPASKKRYTATFKRPRR